MPNCVMCMHQLKFDYINRRRTVYGATVGGGREGGKDRPHIHAPILFISKKKNNTLEQSDKIVYIKSIKWESRESNANAQWKRRLVVVVVV